MCRYTVISLCLLIILAYVNGSSFEKLDIIESELGSHVPRSAWFLHSKPCSDHIMTLNIALKQRNMDQLKSYAIDISNPLSINYGLRLSIEELTALIQPKQEDIDAIIKFFEDAGASVYTVLTKDFLTVKLSISTVESLFQTRIHRFAHKASKRTVMRASVPTVIPSILVDKIDLITGLYDFFDYATERKSLKQQQIDNIKRQQINRDFFNENNNNKDIQQFPSTAQCGSSAPEFLRPRGSEKDALISFKVWCKNGQTSTNPISPCSDQGLPLSSVNIYITYYDNSTFSPIAIQVSLTNPTSPYKLHCSAPSGFVTCYVSPSILIPAYERFLVSGYSTFADNSVSPLDYFPTMFSPSTYLTPQKYYEIYNVPQGYRGTNRNNRQSVTAFEEQYIDVAGDLTQFFQDVGMPFQAPIIHGQNDQTNPGGESTLDIEYIMGIGAGVESIFWSVTGPGPAIPPGQGAYILEWALEIANTTDDAIPWVTSISYGDTEIGYYNKFNGSYIYIDRMNNELAKMAARRMTVAAGSGDAGATNVGEQGNDISPTDPDCSVFRAFYPSNSYWVTSVSSTFLTTKYLPICEPHHNIGPQPIECTQVGERAISVRDGLYWTTGGGFSGMASNPTPSYQEQFVTDYLMTAKQNGLLPPTSYFNPSGRGYPDVATVGHNLICVLNGELTTIDGTSASGPVWGGLVSLINDVLLNNAMNTTGFMNPLLYLAKSVSPESFRDVVMGSNFDGDLQPRCSQYPTFCPYGFSAQPKWSPITGLGTPNWGVLSKFALYNAQARHAERAKANSHNNNEKPQLVQA